MFKSKEFFRYMLVVELGGKGYIFAFSQDLKIEILEYYNQLLSQYDGLNMLRENAMYDFYNIVQTGQYQNHPSIESLYNNDYSIHIIDTAQNVSTEPSFQSTRGVKVAIYLFFVFIHLVLTQPRNNYHQQANSNLFTQQNNVSSLDPRLELLDTTPLPVNHLGK